MTNQENAHLLGTQNIQDLVDIWSTRAKPVVIWAGAGLSAPAKLPTWHELRNTLTDEAVRNARSLRNDDATRRQGKIKAIREIESHWKAFELLEEIAAASFQGSIRQALVESLRCPVPSAYSAAWELGIKGILTLNIDGLASRAFRESSVGNLRLHERNGFDIRALAERVNDFETPMHINLVSMDRVFSSASSPAWVG